MAFYGEENARSDLRAFYEQVRSAWCIESCSPSLRDEWNSSRPSAGQCFVTAILVQDRFGGDIFETHFSGGAIHYFNRIDGEVFDLTSEQFGGKVKPSVYAAGVLTNRALRLSDPIKAQRCEALRAALKRAEGEEYASDQPCV